MIKIYKTTEGFFLEQNSKFYTSAKTNWDELINQSNLYQSLLQEIRNAEAVGDEDWLASQKILAPIGSQEVWAAGVTYLRSKVARMEESEESGGATDRPRQEDAVARRTQGRSEGFPAGI